MRVSYRNPEADAWFDGILRDPACFPFRFVYDGEPVRGFSQDVFLSSGISRERSADKETAELCFRKDENLYVTLRCTHYFEFGVTEWTVWFENRGKEDTGVLSEAETVLAFPGKYPTLKGILGDHVNAYRPYALDVGAQPRSFESNSGRATHVCFPYFNLEYGDGGVMLAIGWAGTWRADFRYNEAQGVTEYRARSVNNLRARLHPGEKIRTALFVRAPYRKRNEDYAANFWRSWFVRWNLPPADGSGTPLSPFSTCCLAGDTGRPNSDGSISEDFTTWRPSLEKMIREGVQTDFRWFDAGWYAAPNGSSPQKDWWGTVGTWALDSAKWPGKTFLESTDFARAHGMKTIMWFEPERVTDPEALAKNWGYDETWAIRKPGLRQIANNIGDPACFRWTVDRIQKTLLENRVELYREDNNSDPAVLWRHLDGFAGDDRGGITECRQIGAHYRMWDEIIACTKSYGGCAFVDSCASGGGRNDLESLRRGVPLLRSDADRTTAALRLSMTTAFNRWVPMCGANNREKPDQLSPVGLLDEYVWRASYLPVLNVDSQFVYDPDQDFSMLRWGLDEWKRVSPYLLEDFYVLTPWHTAEETTGFTAYVFFDPDASAGVLLAFRQEKCQEETVFLPLPFAGDSEGFSLRDEDTGETLNAGRQGITLRFSRPRQARLLWIKALDPGFASTP
ncbi:MAG: alpha-galactosidase [Clostridia bacterium]|nr:alpha-galactosidase [Clostridia bacterium]